MAIVATIIKIFSTGITEYSHNTGNPAPSKDNEKHKLETMFPSNS